MFLKWHAVSEPEMPPNVVIKKKFKEELEVSELPGRQAVGLYHPSFPAATAYATAAVSSAHWRSEQLCVVLESKDDAGMLPAHQPPWPSRAPASCLSPASSMGKCWWQLYPAGHNQRHEHFSAPSWKTPKNNCCMSPSIHKIKWATDQNNK